jgi:hypothetical protein
MNNHVLFTITEFDVQNAAEAACNRELTEKELKRLKYAFLEYEEFYDGIYEGLYNIVDKVTEESGIDWSDADKKFEGKSLDEVFGYQLAKKDV